MSVEKDSKGDYTCFSYQNSNGTYVPSINCKKNTRSKYPHCCGTCHERYCCKNTWDILDQRKCGQYKSSTKHNTKPGHNSFYNQWYLWLLVIVILLLLTVLIICKLVRRTKKLNSRHAQRVAMSDLNQSGI